MEATICYCVAICLCWRVRYRLPLSSTAGNMSLRSLRFYAAPALALFVMLPRSGAAAQATSLTKANYTACATRAAFKEQSVLQLSGDKKAWREYVADHSHGCAVLPASVEVHIANLAEAGLIKVRRVGSPVWLFADAEAVLTK